MSFPARNPFASSSTLCATTNIHADTHRVLALCTRRYCQNMLINSPPVVKSRMTTPGTLERSSNVQAAFQSDSLDLLEIWHLQVLNFVVVNLLLVIHLLPPELKLRAGLVAFDVDPELVNTTANVAEADISTLR